MMSGSAMIRAIFRRARKVCGRLTASPAFVYAESEEYLRHFVRSEWPDYEKWLHRNRLFTLHGLRELYDEARTFRRTPLISVIMPVYNPDPEEFRQAVESLLWQAYPHWELCIADDCSSSREYLKTIGRIRDRRIKITQCKQHRGISETSQCAVAMASGQYLALLDQDDELYPDALFSFVKALQDEEIDFFYSDMDKISPQGNRYFHYFKPGWSPEYLLSLPYVSHLKIIARELVIKVGGFRREYDGSQDYDLALRISEHTDRIHHYPMALYSYRQSRHSIALDPEVKEYVYAASIRALEDACRRRGLPVKEVVEDRRHWRGNYRLVWDPSVLSGERVVFFVTGDCSDSEKQGAAALCRELAAGIVSPEIIVIDGRNETIYDRLRALEPQTRVFFCDGSLTGIVAPALLDMLGYLTIKGVGAVGCKFLKEDGLVASVGLAVHSSGRVLSLYRGQAADVPGYGAMALASRNVALVSPSFWGGSAGSLQNAWPVKPGRDYFGSAIDCLMELGRMGERIVVVPTMCLRVGQESEEQAEALRAFGRRWHEAGYVDRFYNPNLTGEFEDCGLQL